MQRKDDGISTNLRKKNPTKLNLLYRLNHGPFLGLIYTFLCSLCTVFTILIVKKMIYTSPGQLAVTRNVGAVVFSIPFAAFGGENVLGPRIHRRLLIVRAIFGGFAFYPIHQALRLLPLAEATIILSTIPAIVMIGARLFLKESCGIVATFTLVLTFLGVILNVRLPELLLNNNGYQFTVEYVIGLACAFAGVFCIAISLTITRKLKDVPNSTILLYTNAIGTIVNSCMTVAFSSFDLSQCGWDPILMIYMAVLGFGGNSFLNLAIQREAVGIITVVKYSLEIAFAFVLQVLFFNSYPDAYSSCGAIIVIVSVGLIALSKRLLQLPEDSNVRKKFKFMLL